MTMTARGAGLLLGAVALLGAGFGFGYRDLVVIGTAAFLALLFALGYVAWRPRLTVRRRADPDRVMRGESSRVTLTVRNINRLRGATLIAYDRCGHLTVPVPLLRLRPGHETTVDYPVPTGRRGVIGIGPLRVVRRDPLGLLTVPRTHGGGDQVWVYPRAHPLAAVPVGVVRSLDGRIDRVPHGTITFDTLREYVVGDELRRVHWRTSARIGELMVREHLDTSLPRLVILLDDRAEAYPDVHDGTAEAFEAACEAAASIVLAAARAELPLVLHLVSGAVAGSEGRRHATSRQYLDLLAEATLRSAGAGAGSDAGRSDGGRSGRGPLATVTARLRQHRPGDTLIYLTGPGDMDDLGQVSALRGAYPTVVVGTLGGTEPIPSTMDGILVLAAADGASFAAAWDEVRAW